MAVVNRRKKSRKSGKESKPLVDPEIVIPLVSGVGLKMTVAADDVVFSQGDPADAVFYIETGAIQIHVVSDKGKQAIIAGFGAGDFFGEGCFTQPLRLASAVATTSARIVRIDRKEMIRLLREKPSFSEKFTAFLVARNIQVEADIVDHLFDSSEKRLARLLLLLANFNNEHELKLIVPKISHEMLAARVGTTRSRINYFMNKFRRHGLIEYNGEIKVHTGLLNVIVHD